jgi:serine/threonine protein kinase
MLTTLKTNDMLQEYRIEKHFAEGNFGQTFLAYDTNMKKHVVLKGIPADRVSDFSTALEEIQTLSKFDSPNIVKSYRFFEENDVGYIVMEYIEGQTFKQLLKIRSLNEKEAYKLIALLVTCLQKVHDMGVLHGDIKPANIIIRNDGSPVLIDFGAAQKINQRSDPNTLIFTPGYAAPEQFRGDSLDYRADIYSLAAVAHQCVTKQMPQPASERAKKDHMEVLASRPKASKFLTSIDWALKFDKSARPRSLTDWRNTWGSPDAVTQDSQEKETKKTSENNNSRKTNASLFLSSVGVCLGAISIYLTVNPIQQTKEEPKINGPPDKQVIEEVYQPRSKAQRFEVSLAKALHKINQGKKP